jgi:NADH-quinone oxidoreductase subunit M
VYVVIAALGTVLAAGYLLWLFQRIAFGEPKAEFAGASHDNSGHGDHGHGSHGHDDHAHDDHSSDIKDVSVGEWIAWTPFLLAIVVFGVYPQLMFKIIDPAVQVALKAFGG